MNIKINHEEQRCRCGHLLGLLISEGFEIKCKRCKRLETITFGDILRFLKDIEPLSSDPSRQTGIPEDCLCHAPIPQSNCGIGA